MKYIRRFNEETSGMVHLPRLLAITIPFTIITIAHMLNAIGVGVPGWLVDPTINLAMVAIGAVVTVLGLSVGFLPLFLIIVVILGFAAYIYLNYTLGII
jgi:hypothetical protein